MDEEERKVGIPSNRFAEEVDEEFICIICQDVLNDPVQTPCDHLFCRFCLGQWLEDNKTCPADREDIDPDAVRPVIRPFKNLLMKLKIRCGYEGCPYEDQLIRIDTHQSICTYRPEVCPNVGCSSILPAKDLLAHAKECPHRTKVSLWSCAICTFFNFIESASCEMCEQKKPDVLEAKEDIPADVLFDKAKSLEEKKEMKRAIELYQAAAQLGHSRAQNNLGVAYENGDGVPQDQKMAIKLYEQAAKAGNPAGQFNLAVCYENATGVYKDMRKAVRYYELAARQGRTDAQYALGVCYATGEGVPQNQAKAIEWYQKAAEGGEAEAQYALGLCFDEGDGVPEDKIMAAFWFYKASLKGHAQALEKATRGADDFQEAKRHEGYDKKRAYKLYLKAAQLGYAPAMNNLAACLESGDGIRMNKAEAIIWFRRAADQGNSTAQFNLAERYENGDGVLRDYNQAFAFYKMAADSGSVDAMFALAQLYYKGQGVDKDEKKARDYCTAAADKGHIEAQVLLGLRPKPAEAESEEDDDDDDEGGKPKEKKLRAPPSPIIGSPARGKEGKSPKPDEKKNPPRPWTPPPDPIGSILHKHADLPSLPAPLNPTRPRNLSDLMDDAAVYKKKKKKKEKCVIA